MISLNYIEMGDKYLLTLKDMTKKTFLCKKQEIPKDFAIYGVPVEDLDDPADIMRTLKARLEYLLIEEAHQISQVSPTKISREFFSNPQRTKNYNSSGATKVKVNKTNDPNAQSVLTEKMGVAMKNKVEKSNL